MKIFLSWSGTRSKHVAQALKPWLKSVIQSADPWLSVDMERGTKWLNEISKTLDDRTLGIICVTPGNANAPWLLYEAGALSRHLGDEGRLVPYLYDFRSPGDLKAPLGQFNAALANKEGTRQLVVTLNKHAETSLDDDQLREQFELWWPKLEAALEKVGPAEGAKKPVRRTNDEKLDELLSLVRGLERSAAAETAVPTEVDVDGMVRLARGSLLRRAIQSAAEAMGLDVATTRWGDGRFTVYLAAGSPEPNSREVTILETLLALHHNERELKITFSEPPALRRARRR